MNECLVKLKKNVKLSLLCKQIIQKNINRLEIIKLIFTYK